MKVQATLIGLAMSSAMQFVASQNDNETIFDNCDVDSYYDELLAQNSDPTQWSKEDLTTLVRTTHRNILPTIGSKVGDDDVYAAIIDLDPGNETDTVRLLYRNIDMGATPYANPLYWNVERLWPVERGYNRFSPAYTDVHQVRPADSTVLLLKGLLLFGMCDTVEYADACVSPANDETAPDTAQDGKIWQPPAVFRGEIARALFYMDLRYDQLTLKDCGPFTNAMAYRSQLLEWHADHPPTEDEIERNNQACRRWQGNRNPFVDFPELAVAIHGEPEQIMEGTRTYPTCIELFPTQAPTATPNECGNIRTGDMPIFLVNSDDPDDVIILPLIDVPPNLELFITDEPWNGTSLLNGLENEGALVFMTPEEGIEQGTLFGYGGGEGILFGDQWIAERGAFSLDTDGGDNVFLYCIDADSNIRFLSGFSNYGNWSDLGLSLEEYGTSQSALPDEIRRASIVLPHMDNYFYNGSRDETIFLLRADIVNPVSWVGDNEGRFGVQIESSSWVLSLTASVSVFGGVIITLLL